MLNSWLKSQIGEAIEHLFAWAGPLAVAHGVTQSQANGILALVNPEAIAGFLVAVLNCLWAVYRAGRDNKLINAVQTGAKGASVMASAKLPLIALLLLPVLAQGQLSSNAVNDVNSIVLPALGIGPLPTNVVTAANDLAPVITNLIPELTNLTAFTLTGDALTDGKRWGGLGDFEIPVPGTTNWLSAGVGGAYCQDWFVFPVSAKVSKTITIPWLNIPLYIFAESGWSLRVRDDAQGNQTALGGAVAVNLSKKVGLVGDGGKLFLTQSGAPNPWLFGARLNIALK